MHNRVRIAAFTSIRSEYGLLLPVLRAIENDAALQLELLVGGAHLRAAYGNTKDQVVADGFTINTEFDFLANEQEPDFITSSLSRLQAQGGSWLALNKPDLLLVLGDRFELLPMVAAALLYNIPVAHISGGDVTEGAVDNQVRHAVTKMAHLHFPAAAVYRENLLKMGEEDWRICVSGEPGLDEILGMPYMSREEVYESTGLEKNQPFIIATFHPETIQNAINESLLQELFDKLLAQTPYQLLVTASNFDHGGAAINNFLETYSTKNKKCIYIKSLGQRRYYSTLKYASCMIGNSSSGLVEAQSFNLPVINVGNRQKGRLSNANVFHVPAQATAITGALEQVTSEKFKQQYFQQPNVYGDGKAAPRIVDFIKKLHAHPDLLVKKSTF